MSRIGRRDTSAARLVDQLLFHIYGKRPVASEAFHKSGRQSWEDEANGHEWQQSGGRVYPVGRDGPTDGKGADFRGADKTVEAASDRAEHDLGTGDSMTFITHFFGPNSPGWNNEHGLMSKWDGGGIHLEVEDVLGGSVNMIVRDGANDQITPSDNGANFLDGSDHTCLVTYDRDVDTGRIFSDGVLGASQTESAIDDCSASNPLYIGAQGDDTRHWDDPFYYAGAIDEWISEPVAAFLDALVRTGDVAPGTIKRIESWLSGNSETGWSRKPLDYVAENGLWDDAYFTFDSNRLVHGVDGVGLVQFTSQSGTRKYTQRTKSNRPIVRRTQAIGAPADHLEFTGGEKFTRSESTTIDQFSFYGAIKNTASDNTGTDTIALWDSGSSAFLVLYYDGSGDFVLRAEDDNGNSFLETLSGPDYSKWTAFVATVDFSAGTYRLVAEDATGTSGSINSTASGTNTSVASSTEVVGGPSGSGAWTSGSEMIADLSNLHAVPVHLTNSEQDDLLADLATRLPQ